MHADKELDASGLACPMPIVKARKAMMTLAAGEILKVTSTDSGSVDDMPAFADQLGHTLLATANEGGRYVFWLRKN
ncbi:MAG: sulfurtransferase TusA family protein [Rubrivivax sp.]|jgi:tRNA 2-thiouridine synthesizing protein A|nr:sulfurtransferase TusA family protein [Rubrivivax sp.]